MKIRTKLGILPIALAVIMLTVSLLITILISNNTVKNQIGNHLLSTAQSRAHNIETLLNDYKEVVHTLAVGIPFTNVFDTQIDYTKRINDCNLRIKRTIESYPDISTISILNKNGIVISSSNEDIGSDLSDNATFKKGKENVYIADIHKSEETGNLVLSISAPIFLRGTFSGVLIINFNVEKKLFKILTDKTGLGKTGEIYLVNKDGILLSPSRFIDNTILKTKINTKQVNLFLSEHLIKGLPENEEQKPTDYQDYRGEKVLGVHFYIPEMQWGLIAEFDIKEVYKPINEQTILLITIFSILLLAVLFFAFKISRDITLPIIKMHEGTEEIIKGNLDHKINIESKDEIGELSYSFDIMTDKLKKAQTEINSHTEVLETTVKERTDELEKQFEKSEKQRIATLVVMNDLNKNTKELKAEITERKHAEQIQKVLYNISNAVVTTDNLERLIKRVQEELGTIIDTTNFYIGLYDSKTDTLSLPFFVDEKDDIPSFPAGKTLTYYVIKTQKSLLATKEELKILEQNGDIESFGTNSKIWLGVPLKIEGKITGVLAVQSYTDKNAFDESDLKILEFVSDQISISIDRKKAEQDLKTALIKATESDKLKTAFLNTISHELRTPLNAVIGFSNLINNETENDIILDFAKRINDNGNQLLGIVEDIFDVTMIESGGVKIQKEEFNITTFMDGIHKMLKAEQEKDSRQHIDIYFNPAEKGKDFLVYTDRRKLKQILTNLLKNALKFTHEGNIEYGYMKETQQDEPILKFYVKDTGIGISKEKQEIIFEIFRQADDTDTRLYGGTGIGLSVSKKLTEFLGGKIWVDSKEKKGSTFYFTLPYLKP